ncbi:hypothetical protein TrLO_g4348 [Triparma laevis f. longispina]|uniref:Uncharacterized protein n=1 Tax=Triparma laevis f. longispina TaxID=1714387 RepID=A0A9W7AMU8_9STRA|nr:hypothetical protein TrLO_g4348 [Triparma laevis f. longispina]
MSSRRFLPLLSLTPLPLYLLSPHSNCQSSPPSPSFPSILKTIRSTSTETRLRWIRDEDHWRKLPSRAWPSHQPSHDQEEKLREVYEEKCGDGRDDKKECVDVTFRLATCLVFNNLDAVEGLKLYEENFENERHADSAVAAGIVLVEGFHRADGSPFSDADVKLGSEYISAAAAMNNTQGKFELGCLYYTGAAEPHVKESSSEAFKLFEETAAEGHTSGQFMCGDLLMEGDGCEVDKGRALSLMYEAAEKGHRFARQRVIEVLDDNK